MSLKFSGKEKLDYIFLTGHDHLQQVGVSDKFDIFLLIYGGGSRILERGGGGIWVTVKYLKGPNTQDSGHMGQNISN